MKTSVLWLVIAVLAVGGPSRAAADHHAPWKVGVSKQQQQHATKLFDQGNTLFEKREYAKAVELYAQAVVEWDHPQIHFNMAVALISLGRLLDAEEHVRAALKFGAEGLDKDKFVEAQNYQRLLAARLVALTVVIRQPGVHVTFDGSELPTAGGMASVTTTPGNHALVATKVGFEPMTKNLALIGGQPATESIELEPRIRRFALRRRFRAWIPWTIAGAGAGAGLLGAGLIVVGHSSLSEFEAKFGQMFPNGAASHDDVPSSLWSLRTRARVENGAGIALLSVGSAAVVTGLVMIALNQTRQIEQPPTVVFGASAHQLSVTWLGRF